MSVTHHFCILQYYFLFSDFFLFSIPFHTYIEKRSNKTDHFIHWHNSWFLPSSIQHLMSWHIRFVQSTIQVYEFQSVSSVVRKCFKLSLSLSTAGRDRSYDNTVFHSQSETVEMMRSSFYIIYLLGLGETL